MPDEAKPPVGRPSTFSEAIASEICIRIACGDSLAAICREDEMPAYRTVMRWLDEDLAFRQKYVRAREDQADADADAVNDIGERVLKGTVDAQAGRVAIDARKWSAAQRKPKKYGGRVALVGGGPDDAPIRHQVDLSHLTDQELEALEAIRIKLAIAGGDQGGEGPAGS